MASVVTSACQTCKDKSCVAVCPVECFYDAGQMLVIDPEECTDCSACLVECPVEAIFYEENVPQDQREFIRLNAELCKTSPRILS